MPISYSAAGLPAVAAARNAGPPIDAGSAFDCGACGAVAAIGAGACAAMFSGGLTEPVTSAAGAADGAGCGGTGGATGVGAIRLTLGVGATSGSAPDWRVGTGAGAGAAGSVAAAAAAAAGAAA